MSRGTSVPLSPTIPVAWGKRYGQQCAHLEVPTCTITQSLRPRPPSPSRCATLPNVSHAQNGLPQHKNKSMELNAAGAKRRRPHHTNLLLDLAPPPPPPRVHCTQGGPCAARAHMLRPHPQRPAMERSSSSGIGRRGKGEGVTAAKYWGQGRGRGGA